jgi:hypothetical protein
MLPCRPPFVSGYHRMIHDRRLLCNACCRLRCAPSDEGSCPTDPASTDEQVRCVHQECRPHGPCFPLFTGALFRMPASSGNSITVRISDVRFVAPGICCAIPIATSRPSASIRKYPPSCRVSQRMIHRSPECYPRGSERWLRRSRIQGGSGDALALLMKAHRQFG